MNYIDAILNKFTMYRLTLYYLIFLIGIASLLAYFGFISYNPMDILIEALAAVIISYISNYFFAKLFGAVTNTESVFITALILSLIVPVKFPYNLLFMIGASGVAMGSKYLLTIEKRHIFNPAAASVAAIALLSPSHTATWWVGTPAMLPFVLFGGLLLVRKIQRETLVFSFLITYFLVVAVGSVLNTGSLISIISSWQISVFHSALFFFAFVMLTEPLTTPATEKKQSYYGYFTAFLYATPLLRILSFTPEIALCIGNVFSYAISPNYRFSLPLAWKKQVSPDTYVFAFEQPKSLKFRPGQYMEWTLPHKNTDSRGNRRYFSISSSPTEEALMMTVKFYDPSSSYKKELLNIPNGRPIVAAQVAGDFVLPKNLKQPLAFIAGGVGIAPFRSMAQYILDKNLQTDIILIYTNRTKQDILFSNTFEDARKNGLKTIYNLTDLKSVPEHWQGTTGYINVDIIRKEIPDYAVRKFYLSGPQLMVQRFEKTLLEAGVPRNNIITDFFPGYNET